MHPTLSALAGAGRYGDSMVAHLTPQSARTLKAMGGAGTVNPSTGAREYFTADWYLAQNPDVAEWANQAAAATGKSVQQLAQEHYNNHGSGEGRLADPPAQQPAPAPTPQTSTPPPPRYGAPQDVQSLYDMMTEGQRRSVADGIGFSGDINSDAYNQYVGGRSGEFENLVRTSGRYGAPEPVQTAWNAMPVDQRTQIAQNLGFSGSPTMGDSGFNADDLAFNEFVQRDPSRFESAVMNAGQRPQQVQTFGQDTMSNSLSDLMGYFNGSQSNPFQGYIDSLNSTASTLDNRLGSLEGQFGNFNQQVGELGGMFGNLSGQFGGLQNQFGNMNSGLSRFNGLFGGGMFGNQGAGSGQSAGGSASSPTQNPLSGGDSPWRQPTPRQQTGGFTSMFGGSNKQRPGFAGTSPLPGQY